MFSRQCRSTVFVSKFLMLGMLAAILPGCAPTTPKLHVFEPLPPGSDPAIYVTAALQKDAIIASLRKAGFHITDHIDNSIYLMRVTVGIEQGEQPCGTLNNVRYELRANGETLIEAKAKGWTGSCQPNVFDDISRELKQSIAKPASTPTPEADIQ